MSCLTLRFLPLISPLLFCSGASLFPVLPCVLSPFCVGCVSCVPCVHGAPLALCVLLNLGISFVIAVVESSGHYCQNCVGVNVFLKLFFHIDFDNFDEIVWHIL